MRRRDLLAALAASPLFAAKAASAISLTPRPPRFLFADPIGYVGWGAFSEFGDGVYIFDYAGNRGGRLGMNAEPVQAMLSTFDDTGQGVATVALTDRGLKLGDRSCAPIWISRNSFTVKRGEISLSAEIARRGDDKIIGTIVLIYGSGPAPKEAFDFWSFHFLAQGWAVVTYDKRGSGRSTGDWREASLEDLAADARAIIAACSNQPRPIGVWGASQAGWIMPQLAAQSLVDFVVMNAGAATTPRQQIIDSVEAELHAYGLPQEEIEKAKAYYALDTDVSCGRKPWSAIDSAYKAAVAAKAEWIVAPPPPADAPERTFIRLVADFDPAPYWRQTKVPVLALFGAKDVIVPPPKNRDLLRTLIPRATPFQDHVLESANHLFMIADTGVRAEYPKRTSIHPAYFKTIDEWLIRLTRR